MKKRIFIAIIALGVLLTSCSHNQMDNINIESYETIGNTAGNIQNSGYVVEHQNKYYYTCFDDYKHLYSMDMYGKNKQMISTDHFHYELNIYQNSIYYISSYPGNVWKLDLNTFKKKRLIRKRVGNLLLAGGKMFYRLSEDDNWGKLCSSDLDGKNTKILANKVENFCVQNDTIYYCNIEDENSLYSMKLDGSEKNKLNNSYANFINADDNHIIYSDQNRNHNLYCWDIGARTEKCISEDICWNVNLNNEWIYYRNQSDLGNLYRIKKDGSYKQKIATGNIVNINVIGDRIFYRRVTENIGYFTRNIKDIENEQAWPF